MAATAQSQRERAELDAVIQSGIFGRAPNLSNFLTYVCERYFEGAAEQIKEYNIAVEALGRPPNFDQKKDSIVRVEAHRLRKRLSEYYAAAGSAHTLQIVIPNGQYAPQFVVREAAPAPLTATEFLPAVPLPVLEVEENLPLSAETALAIREAVHEAETQAPAVMGERRAGNNRNAFILVAAAVVCLAGVSYWSLRAGLHSHAAGPAPVNEVWKGDFSEPVSSEFRMLAGYHGETVSDRQGHKWMADAYYNGGRSVPISPLKTIECLPDPDLLHGMREGGFHYDIPVRAGTYELHLYFAETRYNKRNSEEGDEVRSFQVTINGQNRLDLFDPLSEAGAPNRSQMRVFKDVSPAADGKLHLEFAGQTGDAFLNALEILSSAPGRIRPIRIAARRTPVTDAEGHVWAADEYMVGGHLVERASSVLNVGQKNLFEGERFGNFSYRLPVVPGKYRITLRFAETYFGSQLPNAPPYEAGVRLFDVFANGVALLRDFDIASAAGGPNRGVERTFEGLQPNAQGLIVLEFVPLRNYACINAIEVRQTE